MRFFRDNSDSIVKLYINQIGVAIFSMFLYTAAGALSVGGIASLLIKVGISVFAVLFYFSLIALILCFFKSIVCLFPIAILKHVLKSNP